MLVMPLLIVPATAQTTPSNTDTTLSALTLSQGNLLSTFASDKTTYAFAVQSGATEITVTATPTNSGATVTITPADASATSGHQVDVSTLPVSIRIVVSPATGTTTLTYTVSAGNFTDYDTDGDNLIELGTGQTGLAQLHAMRWDLNGNGFIDASATTSDTTAYNTAFSNRPPGMGCETTCTGYELMNNLNFDENSDNEITSADATYWNSGAGFLPLGTYTGTFKGNNKTISNLYINRGSQNDVGLFVVLTGTVSGLGLRNVDVRGNLGVGGLTGHQRGGAITGCYVTGRVRGSGSYGLGGLVGHSHTGANRRISASYSAAAVTALGSGGNFWLGGLVGPRQNGGTIVASYATGAVTGSGTKGGLVGRLESGGSVTASYAAGAITGGGTTGGLVGSTAGTVSNSYWDSDRSGIAGGKSTSDLQSPTTYGATNSDTYYDWNLNVDGDTNTGDAVGNDDPWTFGATDQYPVLKYAGMDTTAQYNLQPPGIPTSVTVTTQADTLDVRWTAASYATGYKVQWKSGMQSYAASREGTVTGTRYKIANLLAGTYTVRVIATKTGVPDGMPSAEQTGVSVLGSPAVMVAAKVDTLTVTWNVVDDATGYKVQWKSGAATYPTSDLALATRGQATIAGGSITIHKISGLTAGTTYTIRVIATSTNSNVADSAPSEEVMVTLATTRPTNVRVTPGPVQLIVRWTEATGATGYKVQWKSGGQSYNTSSRQATVSGGSTTTYTIENLTFGTTYTVRVLATLSGGGDSTPSDEVMGTPQGFNYDSDGDGLIDIKTLAQLHAIRWDLNGDGVVADNDTMTYNAAFPNRDTTSNIRMGCPSGTCTGYELLNNLDFDENGDGEITSADATYWDNGDGWLPIGTAAARYTGDFKGNGYTIDNLTINRPAVVEVGLFGNADTASRIESVGVTNASVAGGEYAGALVGALRGDSRRLLLHRQRFGDD